MTAPVRPKKQLGQHFLHDRKVAERIASQISPLSGEHILEIGPGTGALTVFLAEKYPADLTLVEIDPEAQAYLARQFPNVPLIGSDILTYELPNQPYVFISNLPYNISSPVLFYVLKYREIIREAVFMVQKEVAQRICASEGNKTYGILSVLLGYYYEREYLFTVGKGAFTPPPKVESAVFRLQRLPESERPLPLEVLAPIVKTAFGQRRKTLGNALKSMNMTIPEAWQSLRAEQLSISQFAELAEINPILHR
jgi:16S rRNA (adenine1518-N6/adenine1519-N6)-dimethyltransferase